MVDLYQKIRDVANFPKKGIIFRDITPLLKDPEAFATTIETLFKKVKSLGIDLVAGIESRGFIFGAALAIRLGTGFIPIRKFGKLPHQKISQDYQTEYSQEHLEIHKDAIGKGQKVLIVDDLLATGGTAAAAAKLVEKLGGQVAAIAFLIELEYLEGRKNLVPYRLFSLLKLKN